MRKNLADLVDERHCVDSEVAIDSVKRALVKFTEAIFFLNVIACETELKNKQAQETACDGLSVSSKASGEAMTPIEISLLEVMKAYPDEREVTIEALALGSVCTATPPALSGSV